VLRKQRDELVRLENRALTATVQSQQVLTRDNLALRLSFTGRYRLADPQLVHEKLGAHAIFFHSEAQLFIRAAVATRDLQQVLDERNALSDEVEAALRAALSPHGLSLEKFALRDIMLDRPTKQAWAAVPIARQQGLAALERARGETAALRNLANAAAMLKDNPELARLRAMHVMSEDTRAQRTFVLGVPTSKES
jgi:regulator of protease activity HflC (stomatin/prohibitin superfamily)